MSTGHDSEVGEAKRARFVRCQVITPEKVQLDVETDFVALPIVDGELGVLPGRAPLVGRLGHGELRTRRGAVVERFFVDGGFVQVRDDLVTVLTPRAIKAEFLNLDEARRALELATGRLVSNPIERVEREKALDRARGLVRVASKGTNETH